MRMTMQKVKREKEEKKELNKLSIRRR